MLHADVTESGCRYSVIQITKSFLASVGIQRAPFLARRYPGNTVACLCIVFSEHVVASISDLECNWSEYGSIFRCSNVI